MVDKNDKILKEARSSQSSQQDSADPSKSLQTENVKTILKAAALVCLAAIASPISILNLSPVYGSIPASLYHSNLITFVACLAFVARRTLINLPYRDYENFIAPLMFWTVPIQCVLFTHSESLGPVWGPLIAQACTFLPVLLLTLLSAGFLIDRLKLSTSAPSSSTTQGQNQAANPAPTVAIFVAFSLLERQATKWIPRIVGSHALLTRTGLQLGTATLTAFLTRSLMLALIIPANLHTLFVNPHLNSLSANKMVNSSLYEHQYAIVERKDSLTGYISVVHNKKDGYLVMRCDHSLLGGEWLVTPKRKREGYDQRETVYAVFTMLEAVRLIKNDVFAPNDEKDALFIGLGAGTAPKAFIQHGINTTIVEIDPVVHEFATKYFHLPSNHNKVIADAVNWVGETVKHQPESFDYIIHDVFTGGAEPVDLFTREFIEELSLLLKEDGSIAINYAGDITRPSTRYVLNTILSVFPSCRIFRDTVPDSSSETFLNMVIFCIKAPVPITWRLTKNEDYLGSLARRAHMPPDDGHEIAVQSVGGRDRAWSPFDVLTRTNASVLEEFSKEGAVRHWEIMRTVMPAEVWENW